MPQSILFRVKPDGEGARWLNAARSIGLAGLLLGALAALLQYRFDLPTVARILYVPAGLLGLGNLVWLYILPSLLLAALYSVASVVLAGLHFLHVVVLQKTNDELVYFFAKLMNMRTRVAAYWLGLNQQVPHVDLYASAPGESAFALRFKSEQAVPMPWVLLRLGILLLLGLFAYGILWAVAKVPYGRVVLGGLLGLVVVVFLASVVVVWVHNALTGGHIRLLVDLQLRLLRVRLAVESYFLFVTNDLNEFRECFRSALDEPLPAGAQGSAWVNPNEPRRLDINLIALILLVVATGGLYLLVWLGRTSRLMGDDPFTIVAVTLVGGLLPLSVIFSRYYRRLEKKAGADPSWILELFMVLPPVNILVGIFTIQYILNLSRRSRAAE